MVVQDAESEDSSIKIDETFASPLKPNVSWYCPVIESPEEGPFENVIWRLEVNKGLFLSSRNRGLSFWAFHSGEAPMPNRRTTRNAVTAILPMKP